MMTSWRTTISGILLSVGAALSASEDKNMHLVGVILNSVAALLLGLSARDNKVTSEQAGANLISVDTLPDASKGPPV